MPVQRKLTPEDAPVIAMMAATLHAAAAARSIDHTKIGQCRCVDDAVILYNQAQNATV